MNKFNRRNAAIALSTFNQLAAPAHARPVLDAVVRAHRGLLVRTAAELLEDFAQDAEDIVQDACLAVLEGEVAISPDPVQAFDDLHAAVARMAIAHRKHPHGGRDEDIGAARCRHPGTTTMKTTNRNTALLLRPAAGEPLTDALDACVRDAIRGNHRAIGRIAMALGGFLHEEARAALGPRFEQGAGDVVQELYLGLLERRFRFPRIRGCAVVWLKRVIRVLAAEVAREMGDREPDPDQAA